MVSTGGGVTRGRDRSTGIFLGVAPSPPDVDALETTGGGLRTVAGGSTDAVPATTLREDFLGLITPSDFDLLTDDFPLGDMSLDWPPLTRRLQRGPLEITRRTNIVARTSSAMDKMSRGFQKKCKGNNVDKAAVVESTICMLFLARTGAARVRGQRLVVLGGCCKHSQSSLLHNRHFVHFHNDTMSIFAGKVPRAIDESVMSALHGTVQRNPTTLPTLGRFGWAEEFEQPWWSFRSSSDEQMSPHENDESERGW